MGGDVDDQPEPPEAVVNAVTTAYYSRAFSAPEAVRGRAQVVFSTATVVATAVLAGGLLSNLANASPALRYAAIGVVALWIIATGASVLAVGIPYKDPEEGKAGGSAYEFVKHVTTTSLEERNDLLKWQKRGAWLSLVALAATLLVTAWWITRPAYASQKVRLALTPAGTAAYARVCGTHVTELTASVQRRSLDADQLVLRPPRALCRGAKVTLRLPRADIAVSASHD